MWFLTVKALHTSMARAGTAGQLAEELEEESQASWWENPICASVDLRSLSWLCLWHFREYTALPFVLPFYALCANKLLTSNGFFQN